jgi:hypothetical protein
MGSCNGINPVFLTVYNEMYPSYEEGPITERMRMLLRVFTLIGLHYVAFIVLHKDTWVRPPVDAIIHSITDIFFNSSQFR